MTNTIDREAPASLIAAKFGSPSKLAQAIGRTPSTVQRWLVKGHIPSDYHADVIKAAKAGKVALEPIDFVDKRAFLKKPKRTRKPAPQTA